MDELHGDACPPLGSLHEVVPGIFAWLQPDGSWWLNNAGAIMGVGGDGTYPAGTFVVDTCATYDRTRAFLDSVASTTNAPVTMAANTHQHGDHTYGNSLLPRETVLIGHEAMRTGLLVDPIIDGCPPVWAPVPDWGAVTRRVPSIAVRDTVTVFNGTRRIELHHPGYAAHTTGDLVAWLPEERVLFAGDLLFHGLTPLVFMGSAAVRAARWSGSRRSSRSTWCPAMARSSTAAHLLRSSASTTATTNSSSRPRQPAGATAAAPSMRLGRATSASLRRGPIPSASCSTSTGRTPTPRRPSSTCSQPWSTPSNTTAAR